MASLSFLGAIQQVTGSCYLLETQGGSRILLDCGMRQGHRDEVSGNRAPFAFDPKTLDAVVLSHAHLDHSGLLPRLTAEGFRGLIHASDATCDLLDLMLMDSAHIQEHDAEWENKWRQRLGKSLIQPLYTQAETELLLRHRQPHHYGMPFEVVPGVTVTFHDAGHILGSAIVQLEIQEGEHKHCLVFSGDLGNPKNPLMHAPTFLQQADTVLMESTYGDRDHRDVKETVEELAEILQQAHKDGGNVLIPSFSVGRTQDLIYHLGHLYQQGRLPQQVVFLDSPMAIKANGIYYRFLDQLNLKETDVQLLGGPEQLQLEKWLPILRPTLTAEESMAINRFKAGAIIIAGSGMCTGGRILHHFKHNIWRSECHIVISGFQAKGTLGRLLVEGMSSIKLLHQRFAVNAQVHTLGGFSAHAGQSQLLEWAEAFQNNPNIYLVHGELEKMQALQEKLGNRLGRVPEIPTQGMQISL